MEKIAAAAAVAPFPLAASIMRPTPVMAFTMQPTDSQRSEFERNTALRRALDRLNRDPQPEAARKGRTDGWMDGKSD